MARRPSACTSVSAWRGSTPDTVMERLAEHGVSAHLRLRGGVTKEVLVDAPDGVRLQLQDVSYCGGGGVLGNEC